jgi:hypothetical protein
MDLIPKDFCITIGTHPSKEISLSQELRLLKAGLLYADHVKLYSLKASLLLMTKRVANVPLQQQLFIIESVAPFVSTENSTNNVLQLKEIIKSISSKKHKTPQEIIILNKIETQLKNSWDKVKEMINKIEQESKIEELNRAIKAGLLDLHVFKGTDNDDTAIQFFIECIARASKSPKLVERLTEYSDRNDEIIGEFVSGISEAVVNGSTYPLLDEEIGSLVSAEIREEVIKVSESAVNRAKHIGLAGKLLQKLPSFELASIDEIIDIRKDLEKPLIRFRSAMINYSEGVRSAPWDADFPSDAEQVFRRDVAPAIIEIEDEIKSNNYFKSLLKGIVDKPLVLPAGSAISLVLSNLSTLPDGISYTLGMGASVASIVYDAYGDWKQKKNVTEQNALYFYYSTGKRLEK